MKDGVRILIVEDNKADVFLIREAIAESGMETEVTVLNDGKAGMDYIDAVDGDEGRAAPQVVLLDLNLPKKSGFEVLQHLKASKRCGEARTVIVTSSDADQDRGRAKALGADAYFRKPSHFDEFMKLGGLVARVAGLGG